MPAEIISEYCEIPRNIQLPSNILERKKEVSKLVSKFKEVYQNVEEGDLYSDPEDDDDIFDDDFDTEDDDDIFDDDFDTDNEESYTTSELSRILSSEPIQQTTVDLPF